MSKKFKLKIEVSPPFKVELEANDAEEAKLKAEDIIMDQFEALVSDSRKYDDFWEYQAKVIIKGCDEI